MTTTTDRNTTVAITPTEASREIDKSLAYFRKSLSERSQRRLLRERHDCLDTIIYDTTKLGTPTFDMLDTAIEHADHLNATYGLGIDSGTMADLRDTLTTTGIVCEDENYIHYGCAGQ
ncbi:hypothetical protein FACS1894184_17120 [Clostridia bacterium]|nr:hypothetical protein FACS1894184_17120 [Clostridia bacterium]